MGEHVTPDSVRNRIKLSSSDIDDPKVIEFIKDATAEIELETDRAIDNTNCSKAEAAAIRDLAAIYCLAHITGGSAAGLNFSIGSLRADAVSNAPPLSILQGRVERLIEKLKRPYLGIA